MQFDTWKNQATFTNSSGEQFNGLSALSRKTTAWVRFTESDVARSQSINIQTLSMIISIIYQHTTETTRQITVLTLRTEKTLTKPNWTTNRERYGSASLVCRSKDMFVQVVRRHLFVRIGLYHVERDYESKQKSIQIEGVHIHIVIDKR